MTVVVRTWLPGSELELVDAARLTRPTRDYTTRLRYVEALITEQLVAAAQRARERTGEG